MFNNYSTHIPLYSIQNYCLSSSSTLLSIHPTLIDKWILKKVYSENISSTKWFHFGRLTCLDETQHMHELSVFIYHYISFLGWTNPEIDREASIAYSVWSLQPFVKKMKNHHCLQHFVIPWRPFSIATGWSSTNIFWPALRVEWFLQRFSIHWTR